MDPFRDATERFPQTQSEAQKLGVNRCEEVSEYRGYCDLSLCWLPVDVETYSSRGKHEREVHIKIDYSAYRLKRGLLAVFPGLDISRVRYKE